MTMHHAPGTSIEIGAVLDDVVATYRKTAPVLIQGALVVFVPVAFLAAVFAGSAGGALLVALASMVASVWYSGMVARTVEDVQDGRVDATLGELFAGVTPVLGQLIVLGLLAGIGIGIGFLLLIVPGLILLTIWSVAAPVAVIERPGAIASLGRSRELVRGDGWTVFGIIVVIGAGLIVISLVVGSIGAVSDSFALAFIVRLALNVAIAPIYALASAVLYFALVEARGGRPAVPGAGGPGPQGASGTDFFGNPVGTPAGDLPGGFTPPGTPAPQARSGWAPPARPAEDLPGGFEPPAPAADDVPSVSDPVPEPPAPDLPGAFEPSPDPAPPVPDVPGGFEPSPPAEPPPVPAPPAGGSVPPPGRRPPAT